MASVVVVEDPAYLAESAFHLQKHNTDSQQSVNIVVSSTQGSHYLLMLKIKDFQVAFSRTNSRQKFTACTVEQQCLMYISAMTVQLLRNKTSANVVLGKIPGRLSLCRQGRQ